MAEYIRKDELIERFQNNGRELEKEQILYIISKLPVTTFNFNTFTACFYNEIDSPNTQGPCEKCSNNPKNGGSGICACTLGGYTIT